MLMRISTLLIIGVTVLAIGSLVKLGFWQLERAAEKQQLFDDFARAKQNADAALIPNLPTDVSALARYSPVQVEGKFHTTYLLLDNQVFQGQVGYQVIGLLEVPTTTALQPVNLGWVAAGYDRAQVPQLTLPSDTVNVVGWWYQPSESGVTLTKQWVEPFDHALRIQKPQFTQVAEALDRDITPALILLAETASFGWPRDWQPAVMPPEKHQAYALQWFSLAIAAVVVVFFVRRSQIKTRKKECA